MTTATVIDASLRFARSNPELVALAQGHAGRLGRTVDGLLLDAITRTAAARELDPTASIVLGEPAQLRVVAGGGASRAS